MKETKPSKEQFFDFVRIQNSGITNMLDLRNVLALSWAGLTRENCFYIFSHYGELEEEYGEEL